MPQHDVYTLGHSPDPDDAFMFYAMAEGLIDLRGYRFEHILQDIQTLNERATRGELHVSAISIHAFTRVVDRYALLPSGASMGDGYGPVVAARDPGVAESDDAGARAWLAGKRVAVPGRMTSAWLALKLFGGGWEEVVVPFDEVLPAVDAGRADAALIIHEGQLTYRRDGFAPVVDLGEWWGRETGLPLPLGGNVIRKDIPPAERSEIAGILRESIRYGLEHRAAGVAHAMPLARGLDTGLADRFIGMYVNDLTLDYGERGRAGIREFLGRAEAAGLVPATGELEFVPYA
jgi:1,4-dihydroxy-6-naphthoate synthase